jgi:hypothetical protein
MTEQGEKLMDYSFLHTTTVERAFEINAETDALTFTCTYYESPEDMQNQRSKEIRFWIYQDDAVALAELILRIARPDQSRN